jgi:hypothetical protein
VVLHFFHVTRFEEFPYEPEKPLILDALAENTNHHVMVDIIEKRFDIALDKPLTAGEAVLYLAQRRVTAFVRTETVRGIFKTAFVNGFQQCCRPFYMTENCPRCVTAETDQDGRAKTSQTFNDG